MLSLYMDGYEWIQLQYKSTKTRYKRPTMEAKLPLLLSLIQSSSNCTTIVSTRNRPSIGTASGISCSSSCITWVGALFTDPTLSLCSFVCPPPRWNRTRTNQLSLPVEVGILTFVTTKPTNRFVFLSLQYRWAHSERWRTCIALAVTHSPITNWPTSLIFSKSDFFYEQKIQP